MKKVDNNFYSIHVSYDPILPLSGTDIHVEVSMAICCFCETIMNLWLLGKFAEVCLGDKTRLYIKAI